MADTTPNESDEQATRETSRRLWSGMRGCLRLVLGLFLVLVAPLQLGIAMYAQAHHGMGDAVEWPNWTGWVMVLCGIGVLWHGWRDVWSNEVGPVFEDLDVLDDVADTLEGMGTDPRIMADVEAFRERVGDHKDTVHDLRKRLEGGQIAPAQALEELDRIANDARTRVAELIEATLATDASSQGRERYARWKGAGISLTAANAEYDEEYWSEEADADIEYNPAATIRLIANSAGVDLNGLPAPATGVLTAGRSFVYLLPMYLDRYLTEDVDGSGDASSSA